MEWVYTPSRGGIYSNVRRCCGVFRDEEFGMLEFLFTFPFFIFKLFYVVSFWVVTGFILYFLVRVYLLDNGLLDNLVSRIRPMTKSSNNRPATQEEEDELESYINNTRG